DHDNLRAVLRWCVDTGDIETEMRLTDALWLFWIIRGHLSEAWERLEDALARSTTTGLSTERARVMVGAGAVAHWRGDFQQAAALCSNGLPMCQASGARWHAAIALSVLGTLCSAQGELAQSADFCAQGLALAREIENRWLTATLHIVLASIALQDEDIQRSLMLSGAGVSLARELGEKWVINQALSQFGFSLLVAGKHTEAHECFIEGLDLCQHLGYYLGVSLNLDDLAGVAVAGGDLNRAARLLG